MEQEAILYLTDERTGELVRVPESKLKAWEKAQKDPPRPLTTAEEELIDKFLLQVYSKKAGSASSQQSSGAMAPQPSPTASAEELAAQLEAERKQNAAEWDQFFKDAGLKNPYTGDLIRTKVDFYAWKEQYEKARNSSGPKSPPVRELSFPISAYTQRSSAVGEKSAVKRAHRKLSAGDRSVIVVTIFALVICFAIAISMTTSFPKSGGSVSPGYDVSDPWSSPYVSDHITMYLGSVNSDLVHRSNCRYAKNIADENRIYYISVENAEKDGRTKCSVCFGK